MTLTAQTLQIGERTLPYGAIMHGSVCVDVALRRPASALRMSLLSCSTSTFDVGKSMLTGRRVVLRRHRAG